MDAEAIGINVGQGLEEIHALHLILHFLGAEVAVGGLLELAASVATATVVEDEDDESLLRHVGLPTAQAIVPIGVDVARHGASVNVNDGGILLRGVEVGGFYQAIVKIRATVGGLDRSGGDLRLGVVLPRVFGGEVTRALVGLQVDKVDVTRHRWLGVVVDDPSSVGREGAVVEAAWGDDVGVHAATVVEQCALARGDVHGVEIALDWATLGREDDGAFPRLIEAEQVINDEVAAGQLTQHLALGVEEVEVVVAVLLALDDELVGVPRQEGHGGVRSDILLVMLGVERGTFVARHGVVSVERHLVLLAVELLEVNGLAVGAPADVDEVAVFGAARLEVDRLVGLYVVDTDGHFVGGASGHGILLRSEYGHAIWIHVDEGIIGHHRLVHAIEGEA